MAHRRAVFLDAVESQLGRGEVLGCFYRDEDSLWHSLSLDPGRCFDGQSVMGANHLEKRNCSFVTDWRCCLAIQVMVKPASWTTA